jgi:hypothetical protein
MTDTLYPLSVVCGFTVSMFSRLWIHCIHFQSVVDSMYPLSVRVDTLNHLYPMNPLYPVLLTLFRSCLDKSIGL